MFHFVLSFKELISTKRQFYRSQNSGKNSHGVMLIIIMCITWNNTGHLFGRDRDTAYINYLCKGLHAWLCTLLTSKGIIHKNTFKCFVWFKAEKYRTKNKLKKYRLTQDRVENSFKLLVVTLGPQMIIEVSSSWPCKQNSTKYAQLLKDPAFFLWRQELSGIF